MMNKNEYKNFDAIGLANLVKNGEVSPYELLDLAIEITEENESEISALNIRLYEEARSYIKNELSGGYLEGVPFLVKDLNVSIKGIPTTMTCDLFKDNIADFNSHLIEQYKKAGLVIFGLTKTPEMALSLTTEPLAHPPTRNPINIKYSPGGSSGGSAAAVCAGYVPAAHGTDGGGSIRVPAALCGLFGLKPSRGRISSGPLIGEGLGGMVTSHVITKSVRDSAVILDISKNNFLGEPYYTTDEKVFLNEIDKPTNKLKIAYLTKDFFGTKISNELNQNTIKIAKLCQSLGHEISEEEIYLGDFDILRAWKILPGVNLLNIINQKCMSLKIDIKDANIEPLTMAWIDDAKSYSALDYHKTINIMHAIGRKISYYLSKYDLILSPTLAIPKLEIGVIKGDHTDIDKHLNFLFKSFSPFTAIFNQSGGAAMSIPFGKTSDGFPLGVHFAGGIGDELKLLKLAYQIEKTAPWT
jgi:amidase